MDGALAADGEMVKLGEEIAMGGQCVVVVGWLLPSFIGIGELCFGQLLESRTKIAVKKMSEGHSPKDTPRRMAWEYELLKEVRLVAHHPGFGELFHSLDLGCD